uniref:HAUS augmin-like complex, subunit 5 n=1 Tax=Neolamprologus brichardi TaxID=32507 RepID=A0A3Q4MTP0_NEOBR
MADRNLVQDLKRWATEEFGLSPDRLPNDSYFKTLCVGTGKSIWKYVIQHVFQQRNVRIMRGNLQWYPFCGVSVKAMFVFTGVQSCQAEGQSEAARRKDLQKKIEQLKEEISHLDSQMSSIIYTVGWTSSRTELHLVIVFLYKDKIIKVKMRERDVRELCDDRVHFYQSLQECESKTQHSAATHMTREQRTAVFQYWLSAVENVLGAYPPNHVLSALQYLASREQKVLEEKLSSLDVTRDVTALQFRYESDHLLDMSAEEENELPPVKTLLEAAWEEVEQSLVELAQTRSRVQQLKNQLQTRKKDAELEVSSIRDELQDDSLALSALEVELQCVMQAAARDHIRDRCIQLDQHAQSRQEALRSLRSQWQSILDFRQLLLRQEQIRGLIKGNSTAKTQLIHLHRELEEFIQARLVPQFEDVTTAANSLRNAVSKEARQMGTVSLLSLDRRTIEGKQRIPASWLSIHRLQSPTFSSVCQSLAFPLYKAPEELCSRSRSQQLELRFLRQLLHLHSATLQKIKKEADQLEASDQKALLSRVMEEDQKLLKSLVPKVRGLTHRCAQDASFKPITCYHYHFNCRGLTFQQWLQRWKLAAKSP